MVFDNTVSKDSVHLLFRRVYRQTRNDCVRKHSLSTLHSVADNVFSDLLSFVPRRVKGEVVNCESLCLTSGLLRFVAFKSSSSHSLLVFTILTFSQPKS